MKLSQTNQFKKDMKKQIKKGKNSDKVIEAVNILLSGSSLPKQYNDHKLQGNWKGRRDCHLEPD